MAAWLNTSQTIDLDDLSSITSDVLNELDLSQPTDLSVDLAPSLASQAPFRLPKSSPAARHPVWAYGRYLRSHELAKNKRY